MSNIFIDLSNNTILLFSLGLIYILVPVKDKQHSIYHKVGLGLLTGFIGLIIMSTPFDVADGIVLDTRSILLSVSGAFLGIIPTSIAVLMTSIYRLMSGGAGAYTGTFIIFITATIGILFGKYRLAYLDKNPIKRMIELYLLGVVVHLVMLLSFLFLSFDVALPIIKSIILPVLVIYPLGSVVLGLLLFRQRDTKYLHRKLNHLSTHDYLTGLFNRYHFERSLLKYEDKEHFPLTIIMGDVNGLKLVNDSFGHISGDELLKTISNVFSKVFRNYEIARWGGDEFVVVLPRTNTNKAQKYSKKFYEACLESNVAKIPLSVAIGYSTKTKSSQSITDTLKYAEEMMYKNKLTDGKAVRRNFLSTLESTLGEHSFETGEHTKRMALFAGIIADKMELPASCKSDLIDLARFHDIGKISVPSKILHKNETLTAKEWDIIKKHPAIGYRIINSISETRHISNLVLAHHERWDGTGYPNGTMGNNIPYTSRLVSIIDAYDVMINGRSYQAAISKSDALIEIEKHSGSQFDPDIVAEFIKVVNDI